MVKSDLCWFPYLKSDGKDKFLSSTQISRMIKQCTVHCNNDDGTTHKVTKVAGPFYKESQARKTSQIWSEQSSEESDDDSAPAKKIKLISNEMKEYNLELPKIPLFPIPNSTAVDSNFTINEKCDIPSTSYSSHNVHTLICSGSSTINDEPSMQKINSNSSNEAINSSNSDDIEILENSAVDTLTEFINEATETDFLIENNEIVNAADLIMTDNTLNEPSVATKVCDKDCNSNLISVIEKNNKYYKSTLKHMPLQMVLLANSNARICKGLANMDNKLQAIMKADSRVRAMALPIPVIPTMFINILPVTSLAALEVAEELLSVDNTDSLMHKENLKSYILMKVGTLTLSAATREAIKLCFEYSILSMFSLKGKTKKRFVDLQLFAVIYESLSGLQTIPTDEPKFMSVLDNYIRHSPKAPID